MRYPVVYVNDGETAFNCGCDSHESLGLEHAADALIATGEVEPFLIVAIASGHRVHEYTPFARVHSDPVEGGGGDSYLDAVELGLKPFIDRTFVTNSAPAATGIVGMSLGGLISVYAGLSRPQTFGTIGTLSGNVFWDGGYFNEYLLTQSRPPGSRLFVDVGLVDDNVFDARRLNNFALASGYVLGEDYYYAEVSGSGHNVSSWRTRMPQFLKFFAEGTSQNFMTTLR